MPYRTADYTARCHVCGEPAGQRCCRCGAPVCTAHSLALAVRFYVPTVACADTRTCHARAPERRPYEPADDVFAPWGVVPVRRGR
ncbi:MAG: hypothetical protein D6689_22460 [Deltaproteobacteria bacterium]|nr:MAG: hypothetical protein D6689_22460 [Deltaproteobacteria bacterium]